MARDTDINDNTLRPERGQNSAMDSPDGMYDPKKIKGSAKRNQNGAIAGGNEGRPTPSKRTSLKDFVNGDSGQNEQKKPAQSLAQKAGKRVAKEGAKATGSMAASALLGGAIQSAVHSAVVTAVGWFAQFVGAVVNFAVGVATALAAGVAAAVTTVSGGFMVAAVTVIVAFGVSAATAAINMQAAFKVADDALVCGPKAKSSRASKAVSDSEDNGVDDAIRRENAQKTYSVLSKVGYSDAQIAGILGCWDAESSNNPKRYETDTPANMFDKLDSDGPTAEVLNGSWSAFTAKFSASSQPNEQAYIVGDKHYIGIGLGQWTGPRSKALWEFAKKQNKSMFDMDVQLAYMIGPDVERLNMYKSASDGKAVDECASLFLSVWEGVAGNKESLRKKQAAYWATEIKSMTIDNSYADSIISAANAQVAGSNSTAAVKNSKDDKCGNKIGDALDIANAEDGTGAFPANLTKHVFMYNELPDSLKKYTFSPADFGYTWGQSSGWKENSGQCVDLTETLGGLIWIGEPVLVQGNGVAQASAWAAKYGGSTTSAPSKGAIFSSTGSSSAGHTGIVTHVFADGSIMIVEQNYTGYSGADGLGKINTWNFRYVTKPEMKSDSFVFYVPKGKTPTFSKK